MFQLADSGQIAVGASPQTLVPYCEGVVTIFAEKQGELRVKVFVGLETHHPTPSEMNRSLANSAA
jgi:hypothetical protein